MGRVFVRSKRQQRVVRIAVWAAVLGLLATVLSQVVFAVGADAHTALKSVSPKDGARLASAPTEVVLTFDDPISESFAAVTVTGPGGSVGSGRATVQGAVVTQPLESGLGDGTYTVAFRVVSADGHPVSDRTTFVLVAPGSSGSSSATSATTAAPESSTSPPSAAEAGPGHTANSGDGRSKRLGLAVGVAALALAAGTALVAATRRRRSS
jgi:methionine-rich copper-binding protein CopC